MEDRKKNHSDIGDGLTWKMLGYKKSDRNCDEKQLLTTMKICDEKQHLTTMKICDKVFVLSEFSIWYVAIGLFCCKLLIGINFTFTISRVTTDDEWIIYSKYLDNKCHF